MATRRAQGSPSTRVRSSVLDGSGPPSEKVDLYRERAAFFRAPTGPELIDLPEAGYLTVDGEGAPGDEQFQDAVAALYGVAYTIKMTCKRSGRDFRVPTFEASWWIESEDGELPRERWRWRLMMMMPDFVNEEHVGDAAEQLRAKGKRPASQVRFARTRQGLCVQMLHVGPYVTEPASIDRMNALMAERGLAALGPHHEVYLGDPRRSKPEKLKTILRQQVK